LCNRPLRQRAAQAVGIGRHLLDHRNKNNLLIKIEMHARFVFVAVSPPTSTSDSGESEAARVPPKRKKIFFIGDYPLLDRFRFSC
jgi:hypothetical protein